jgi:hypothetical protein
MFFKKKLAPEQFEFITVITTAQIYKSSGRMPSSSEIEKGILDTLKDGGYKISGEQMSVLKLAIVVLQMDEFPDLVKKVSQNQDPDGSVYAGIVTKLSQHMVRFI